jgi:hypothetical protein
LDDPSAYPIAAYNYILIQNETFARCETLEDVLRLFLWASSDIVATTLAKANGYTPLTAATRNLVIDKLKQVTCNGQISLQFKKILNHTESAPIGLFVLSMILLVLCVLLSIFIAFISKTKTNVSRLSKFYTFVMLGGAFISYTSIIFWFLEPSPAVCLLRVWFTAVGLTDTFMSLFMRTFVIFVAYQKINSKNGIGQVKNSIFLNFWFLVSGFSILFGVQLLILIIWSATDAYTSLIIQNVVGDLTETRICTSSNPFVWGSLEVAYFGILLLAGLLAVYASWSLKETSKESRGLLISIYNTVLLLVLVVPLSVTVVRNDDEVFIMASIMITFAVTGTIGAAFFPSVIDKIHELYSNSVSNTTKSGDTDKKSLEEVDSEKNKT